MIKILFHKWFSYIYPHLEIRTDVSHFLIGYYFNFYKFGKVYSVVNFIWQKDNIHKEYYVEGVYCSWEALGNNNEIIRMKTLSELLEIL